MMYKKKAAPASTYPIGGYPKDQFGFPHYEKIQQANIQWQKEYTNTLKQRTQKRRVNRGAENSKKWKQNTSRVRTSILKALNFHKAKSKQIPKPHITFRTQIQHQNTALHYITYQMNALDNQKSSVSFTQISSTTITGKEKIIFVIPSTGIGFTKLQAPQEILKANRLNLKENILLIPHFESLENFSSTNNKKYLLRGQSQIEIMIKELIQIINSYRFHYAASTSPMYLMGSEIGGLVALLAGAILPNISGVIATSPEPIGLTQTPEALMIPYINQITDMSEILALNYSHALLLIKASQWPKEKLKKATHWNQKPTSHDLETWLQKNQTAKKFTSLPIAPIHIPFREYNITQIKSSHAWKQYRQKIRNKFLELCDIPKKLTPLQVTKIKTYTLENCLRTEYHIQTTPNSLVNLTLYQPFPIQERPTVICLPGSGSDVAKLESQYVHEVIEQGWNAISIDARVRLYEFHPNIPEKTAVIAQSLKDLLACSQWIFQQPMVEKNKVAVMGVSQGGTHSWMLAALDERICASVPVCGLTTYQSIIEQQVDDYYGGNGRSFLDSHSIYYYIPKILNYFEQQDLCALIAPRAFKPICADHDDCFPFSSIKETKDDLKHIYQLLNATENLEHTTFQGKHSIPPNVRKMAYRFIAKAFKKIKTDSLS